ncbi:unnamed protein product [Vitrella brassicaformis CCMP3155]|uniref:Uncharacterized protein n=2 Tax=Vitrella brassicaformis TaxID=1169539 RepID=A0A0G4F528_VITBC|nr:unnamed protein product [Vitrella brassicaformis CCMP3155]|eukprot:CEM06835.1 unnamed protein product [Vitrella brassicaformis CCMP3155]
MGCRIDADRLLQMQRPPDDQPRQLKTDRKRRPRKTHEGKRGHGGDKGRLKDRRAAHRRKRRRGRPSASFWLKDRGMMPKAFPPAAWCSDRRMTGAIPVPSDFLSTVNKTASNRTGTWDGSLGSFRGADKRCGASFVKDFFGKGRDALLASCPYSDPSMASSETNGFIYYTSIMRAVGPRNNAVITCACDKDILAATLREGNETLGWDARGGDQSVCTPHAKWEASAQASAVYEGREPISAMSATALGHHLSAEYAVGEELRTTVANDDRLVFESRVFGVDGYPWPMSCEATCSNQTHPAPTNSCHPIDLIVDGCPIVPPDWDPHTDGDFFQVHDSATRGNEAGRITFSWPPMGFNNSLAITVRCHMIVFPTKVNETFMCNLKNKLHNWNTKATRSRTRPEAQPNGVVTHSNTTGATTAGGGQLNETGPTVSDGDIGRPTRRLARSDAASDASVWSSRWNSQRQPSSSSSIETGGFLDPRTASRQGDSDSMAVALQEGGVAGEGPIVGAPPGLAPPVALPPALTAPAPAAPVDALLTGPGGAPTIGGARPLQAPGGAATIAPPVLAALGRQADQFFQARGIAGRGQDTLEDPFEDVSLGRVVPARNSPSNAFSSSAGTSGQSFGGGATTATSAGAGVSTSSRSGGRAQRGIGSRLGGQGGFNKPIDRESFNKGVSFTGGHFAQEGKEQLGGSKEFRQPHPDALAEAASAYARQQAGPGAAVPVSSQTGPANNDAWSAATEAEGGRAPVQLNAVDQLFADAAAAEPFAGMNDGVFNQLANNIVYDNWRVNWGRDRGEQQTVVRVGNDFGGVGVGVGALYRETQVDTEWGKLAVSVSTDEQDLEGGVGVTYGAYGVRVDRDFDDPATNVLVVARGVSSGTLVDLRDEDYGQRVKVRNTEVAVRHDFEDTQDPTTGDDEELATEVFVGYKSIGVAVGTDLNDTEVAVSAGVLGYQFSVLRDFDERETDFQGNWGDGWQLLLNGDFVDNRSEEVYIQVGYGRLGTAYVSAGAGVGNDGIPEASFEVETEDVGVGFDFIEDEGNRLFLYSITVGKFTYIWESQVIPANFILPQIGPDIDDVERAILGLNDTMQRIPSAVGSPFGR